MAAALWDSWEQGAILNDKETGIFLLPDKVHQINHQGDYFTVKGPLNIERCPQGRPVIFQAGLSDAGKEFAAKYADVLFTHHETFPQAVAHYAEMKSRAAARGRNPDHLKVSPQAQPIIGSTTEEAKRLYRELTDLTSTSDLLATFGRIFGYFDFSAYDADDLFPHQEVMNAGAQAQSSKADFIVREAKAEGLTLRDSAVRHALPQPRFMGTPEQVANTLQDYFYERACDGFTLVESLPGQLEIFVDTVIPLLQERALFRKDYIDTSLRGNLGIPAPVSRSWHEHLDQESAIHA